MVKFLVQQGPLSLTTATTEAGYNKEEEETLKAGEAKKPGANMPLFDASHGQRPGKPTGTKDTPEA